MMLLIDTIQTKLIVLLQIGKWADRQDSLVNADGDLVGALGASYLAYCNSLRLDLRELCSMAKGSGNAIKPPKIEDLIK
jgi:hypothetical protein